MGYRVTVYYSFDPYEDVSPDEFVFENLSEAEAFRDLMQSDDLRKYDYANGNPEDAVLDELEIRPERNGRKR